MKHKSITLKSAKDFIITITLWVYYIMGYLVFFSPFYLYAYFFSARREEAFQKLNHATSPMVFLPCTDHCSRRDNGI